ncbi:MAG: lipopolysaccharide transport periplasmic protein LptA [Burkholderiales bacterium]|nr:lipopolysaccharide transport periplasmic protein LptA [Burkholderiales bacterium]
MADRPTLAALLLLGAVACAPALAEKADRNKPTNIEANRMSADDATRMSIFEGNVVLTNGTMLVRADRIVVRQDADGFQFATAYGNPVQFRQKGDAKDGREALWTEGEAMRIEIDRRNERVELFERAKVRRGQDMVNGEYIFVDQRTEFFSVSAAKGAAPGAPGGRVKAVIQPKAGPDAQ